MLVTVAKLKSERLDKTILKDKSLKILRELYTHVFLNLYDFMY